jgi:acetyl-CoA C-acetyltransferase/acetyl-CoA acyltransferase
MREVAIIGAGQTRFGNFIDRGAGELFAEALTEALENVDKGLALKEIQEIYIGSLGVGGGQLGNFSSMITDHVGLSGIPAVRIENACASSGFAFRSAILAVASGACDVAVAGGVEKMNDIPRERLRYWLGVSGDTEWERLAGMTFSGVYALMAMRHMHQYGTKKEHLAMVAVKNHANGADNPKAHFQRTITLEQALNSIMVAYPLTLFDCCPTTDGASAVVVCKADMAKKYTDTPVYIIGHGASTDRLGLFERKDFTTLASSTMAAQQAYKMANIQPEDVNLAEVHDCFTIAEIMAYEDLGFCKRGEGGKLIEAGETQIGGRIPVNPSGGLKSKGHPIGATGTGQIYEVFKQLRRQAVKPSRQVSDAEIGLTHNVGGSGGTAVVHIFSAGERK